MDHRMPAAIVALSPFVYASRNVRGWLVSLENKEIRLYVHGAQLMSLQVEVISMGLGGVGCFDHVHPLSQLTIYTHTRTYTHGRMWSRQCALARSAWNRGC